MRRGIGDAHDRLVQDHDERRDEQQIDDESVARGVLGAGLEGRGVHGAHSKESRHRMCGNVTDVGRLCARSRSMEKSLRGRPH